MKRVQVGCVGRHQRISLQGVIALGGSGLVISLAQPRAAIGAQRDVILSLNIDIAVLADELKCSLYSHAA